MQTVPALSETAFLTLPSIYMCRKMVCNKLRRIGEGCWSQDGSTDWLGADSKADCTGLELWRTKWCVCFVSWVT